MLLESNAPDRLSFSRRDVALIVSTCCARAVERQSGGDWRVGGARAALDVRDADGRWYWRHKVTLKIDLKVMMVKVMYTLTFHRLL